MRRTWNCASNWPKLFTTKGISSAKSGAMRTVLRVMTKSLYDLCRQRMGECATGEKAVWAARCLLEKGITFSKTDSHAEELAVYEQLLSQFGESTDSEIHGYIANALAYRGETLNESGRPELALIAYDEVLKRYANATEPEVIEWVEFAKEEKARLVKK